MMATSGLPVPNIAEAGLFLLGGFLLFLGNILLVRAFRTGAASVVAPFQYSQIIWGAGFGLAVFGAPIELATMLGGVIVIFSGWLVLK
jgi:S-adenosylmethionine uptake transporter